VRPDWHRYMNRHPAAQGFTSPSSGAVDRAQRGPLEVRSVADSGRRVGHGVVWFELKFGKKPFWLFGMMGATLFAIARLAGLVGLPGCGGASPRPAGDPSVWTIIQTSIFLAASSSRPACWASRSPEAREVRELRRQLR